MTNANTYKNAARTQTFHEQALAYIAKADHNREVIVGPYDDPDAFYFRSAPDHYGDTFIYQAYYIGKDGSDYILVDVSGDADRICLYLKGARK